MTTQRKMERIVTRQLLALPDDVRERIITDGGGHPDENRLRAALARRARRDRFIPRWLRRI